VTLHSTSDPLSNHFPRLSMELLRLLFRRSCLKFKFRSVATTALNLPAGASTVDRRAAAELDSPLKSGPRSVGRPRFLAVRYW
jgi:hypothetical protein